MKLNDLESENRVNIDRAIIAKAQITNGGPVILLQPENEYSNNVDRGYFASVEKQLRDAGITVPFYSNDQGPYGDLTPGSGEGAVDIYGHDSYVFGFDYTWRDNALPTNFLSLHLQQSPTI